MPSPDSWEKVLMMVMMINVFIICRGKATRYSCPMATSSHPYCHPSISTTSRVSPALCRKAVNNWFWLWGGWPLSTWNSLHHAGDLFSLLRNCMFVFQISINHAWWLCISFMGLCISVIIKKSHCYSFTVIHSYKFYFSWHSDLLFLVYYFFSFFWMVM